MFSERTGYIIWVNDIKSARSLEKYGNIHYISRKMHYVVMYMNSDREEEIIRNIQRLPFVKKTERSYRNEIKTEYERNVPDKTRFYSL
ncbi:YlbG family protein [Paenibacillus sepulcri]|uniref:YlbG family protein n=1 Tax=Paenibacillus sepulcri TaxID=359917 RepID=A0ABS7C7C0_9BACL|nr:YlbG family protein [Paenibacillus sepulcri]